MIGLLIKDTRLLFLQKKFIILLPILTFVLAYNLDGSFALGYLPFVCIFLMIGTLAYDEDSNGYSFLMSLPFERKTYVSEKYVLSILVVAVAEFIGFLIELLCRVSKTGMPPLQEYLLMLPLIFAGALVSISLFFPLLMKYGSEKGKIATLIVLGIIFLAAYLGAKFLEAGEVHWQEAISHVLSENIYLVEGLSMLVALAVLEVSRRISIRIMERKDF